MAVQFQVRRGTATEWSNNNIILALGEFGFDTTNKILKIGDGALTFSALPDLRSTGVIPSGGTNGQGLIKSGTALAWADYVTYPTNAAVAGAALVRNSTNTGNVWSTGAGLGTLTGLGSSSPLAINGTVGGSAANGAPTVSLDNTALNVLIASFNTSSTVFATSASAVNFGRLTVSGYATDTSTVSINTGEVPRYSAIESTSYTARTTNISTGSLADGGPLPDAEPGDPTYNTTTAVVNIGNSSGVSLNHTTNIYGKLKLPQWVSGALITDANGLVGKQTVSSTNVTGAIVARDTNGDFSSRNITATAVTATTVTATTVTTTTVNATTVNATTVAATTLQGNLAGTYITGTITGTQIASATVSSGNIVSGTITNTQIASTANIQDSKLLTISSTGKVANSATTATSANTTSAIVLRDTFGSFSANNISAVGQFNGSGAGLSNIPNASLSTATSANVVSSVVLRDNVGDFSAAIITASRFNGSGLGLTSIPNSATTATSANTNSAIVTRSSTGAFSAGAITATQFNGSGAGLSTKSVPVASLNVATDTPFIRTIAPGNLANPTYTTVKNIFLTGSGTGTIYLNLDDIATVVGAGAEVRVVRTDANFTTNGVVSADASTQVISNIITKTGAVTSNIINTPLSGGGSWAILVYSGSFWYIMASS